MNKTKPQLKVITVDPSLNNWAVIACLYTPDSLKIKHSEVVRIKPNTSIKRKSLQDLDRIERLYSRLQILFKDADVVIAEVPVGSQSARAMVSYAVCLSLLVASNKPVIKVTPNDVKHVVGKNTTTKEEMILWADKLHPEVLQRNTKGVITSTIAEHQADAIAAFYAAKPQLRKFYENYF